MKKLLRVFKEDDSETIDERMEQNDSVHSMMTKQPLDRGRKVEAKVVYQYPKGQFRFPLVPDQKEKGKLSSVHNKKSIRHTAGRAPSSKPSRQKEVKKRQIIEKEEPIYSKKKEKAKTDPRLSEKRQETTPKYGTAEREIRRTRPFQPTAIPSPIYGFKERPSSFIEEKELEIQRHIEAIQNVAREENKFGTEIDKVVENSTYHEIEGLPENHEPEGLPESHEPEVLSENHEPEDLPESHEPEGLPESYEPEVLSENHELEDLPENHEPEGLPERYEPEVLSENHEPEDLPESHEPEGLPESHEPEVLSENHEPEDLPESHEPEVLSENHEPEDLPENHEPEGLSESHEPEVLSESHELEGLPESHEPEVLSESYETEGLSESHEPEGLSVSREISVALEESPIYQFEIKNDDLIINNEHQMETTDIQLESEPVSNADQPKEKSPIPFNVIMLKQDKLKLMQKQNALIPQQENPILISQTEEVKSDSVEYSQAIVQPLQEKRTEPNELLKLEPEEEQMPESKGPEQQNSIDEMETLDISESEQNNQTDYLFPEIELLNPPVVYEGNHDWIIEQSELLNNTLKNFNVGAQVVNVTQGPAVTRFEVQPEPGVKVNKITNLSDDIKLSLAARDIRIEAPIPGKHTIGIEVPNPKSRAVLIREIIDHPEFLDQESPLTAVLGLDISGKPIVTDLRKMPHGLIAGATGSGKSVCINTILVSLLYKATPDQLKLLLIDPKMVELAPYNNIPHLVSPVITDVKAATAALKWAVDEMERRYELFAHSGVRDIKKFNEMADLHKQYADKMPYIVIVIDELADLMMMSPADVEEAISRIAQKARACGIHLIIATQRPSVDVITGLIKANVPTRIAFSVSSQIDSRTIIDISGAEKLLGKGDMLFLENGTSKPVRIQGTYVSDEEIDQVVSHVRDQQEPNYLFQQEELLKKTQVEEEEDELFYEACEFVVEHGGASTSLLQRRFKIGYNRAARLIDMMENQGYISESKGSKPRDVYLTDADLETLQ
ncbi:DNA translocase FtsK [Niallia sp. Krafla_26]|uniref:DNA translocase FtsK n=1 Tax=Niallia sp. Krafla_26 TaxID=3064703 RepID=UPI003D177CE9